MQNKTYLVIGRVPSKPYRYIRSYVLKQKVLPVVLRIEPERALPEDYVRHLYEVHAGRKKGSLSRAEQSFVELHAVPYSTNQFYKDFLKLVWDVEPSSVFAVALQEQIWQDSEHIRSLLSFMPCLQLTYIVQSSGVVKQL